jgi:hypothetical protein
VGVALAVILPLRPVTPDFCAIYSVEPRLDPFDVLREARAERASGGLGAVARNPDVQDVPLNVLLFVPLGMFVRHFLGRGLLATVALGAAASVLVELTQLTGNWGLYPCAYRFFSTSDLVTNTVGAGIGAFLAPALRWVPGQEPPAREAQRLLVTANRRLLAALCNAALIAAVGFAILAVSGLLLDATRGQLFASDSLRAQALRAVTLVLVPGVACLLLVPLGARGRTPGDWAVLLRPVARASDADPSPGLIAARFFVVHAPLLVLAALGAAGHTDAWLGVAALAFVHAVAIAGARPSPDGVTTRTGPRIVDARAGDPGLP